MNINNTRNVIIQGLIATTQAQIDTLTIYASRSGENMSQTIARLQSVMSAYQNMLS